MVVSCRFEIAQVEKQYWEELSPEAQESVSYCSRDRSCPPAFVWPETRQLIAVNVGDARSQRMIQLSFS